MMKHDKTDNNIITHIADATNASIKNFHTSVMILAGEASGDVHGASLVREMKKLNPNIQFSGIGGDKMRTQGVNTFVDVSELAVVGFIEVIAHLPTIYKTFKLVEQKLKLNPPELLILIDYPGFNLRVAKIAKRLGIKVLFYISPQVWAWRKGRVKKIAQVVDHMAVIFPFEVGFYHNANVPVSYVGHPLTHEVKATISQTDMLKTYNISTDKKVVTLLPGSRKGELQRLLPTMLKSAQLLYNQHSDIQLILLQATTIDDDFLQSFLLHNQVPIIIIKDKSYDVMQITDCAITASGTATLEAALMNTPMVVIYKIAAFTAFWAKRLIKIENIALANIIAEKRVVPELLQEQATSENIATEVEKILYDSVVHEKMKIELAEIKTKMGNKNGAKNTAKLAISML